MTRRTLQLALLIALASATAQAQHGGMPGGGGRGMPGGGGMGMPGGINGRPGDMPGREGNSSPPPPPPHGPQLGPPGRWWDDKKTSRSLNLRPEQQQHMDEIFNANKGQLLTLYSNLQREEQKLGSMSSADLADESKVFAGIDRVAQARAELEKENAHILLQIRKELDGQQLSKLDTDLGPR